MSASSAGSQDITARLRKWTHAIDAAPASDLMDEAAREIEMLRMALARLADQDATFSVIGGNMIVDVDAKLTGAEREAIELAAGDYIYHQDPGGRAQHIRATLIGLLERLK
jgi:hypothetical protein